MLAGGDAATLSDGPEILRDFVFAPGVNVRAAPGYVFLAEVRRTRFFGYPVPVDIDNAFPPADKYQADFGFGFKPRRADQARTVLVWHSFKIHVLIAGRLKSLIEVIAPFPLPFRLIARAVISGRGLFGRREAIVTVLHGPTLSAFAAVGIDRRRQFRKSA